MVTIYFDERRINICHSFNEIPTDPNSIHYICKSEEELSNLAQLFFDNVELPDLWVLPVGIENSLEIFASKLFKVEAAGGLVLNNREELLMIFRRGIWDLPKGKRDDGEQIRYTAVREISEECGLAIDNLQIVAPAGSTYHTYFRGGDLNFKETHWFFMRYKGNNGAIRPQTSESIEKVKWVEQGNLEHYFDNSYGSLKQLFEEKKRFFEPLYKQEGERV